MKLTKKALLAAILILTSAFMFADNAKTETSVEDEYLNDVDSEIISTLVESDEYDNKLIALEYISNALSEGNTSPAIIQALDKLAGEGITSETRSNGRQINNFPEIRRQACLLLSKVPTEHSKNTLISIAIADNEPMVAAAAIRSLGIIGINNNDEAVDAIAFVNKRNQVLNPTSSLALEVINAYELLFDKTTNKKTMIDTLAQISTDYHYVTPVRQKAYKLLKQYSDSSKEEKK